MSFTFRQPQKRQGTDITSKVSVCTNLKMSGHLSSIGGVFAAITLATICSTHAMAEHTDCADWGDTDTQLLQLEIGETKEFQLPKAMVADGAPSCVTSADDLQYQVTRSTDPVLPSGFTFDEDEVTVSGCSTTEVRSYRFNLEVSGPAGCTCESSSIEALIRVKPSTSEDEAVSCPADATATEEDSVVLDQTPPMAPWYGWEQVEIGERWRQTVGLDESNQGARITYTARCSGEYDLAGNFVDVCPAKLRNFDVATYDGGVTYITKAIPKERGLIGIYRIRVTARKEDVTRSAATTVILEVHGDDPTPEPPTMTAPEPQTIRIVWDVEADRKSYITGYDLEFRREDGTGQTRSFELVPETTSVTIGDLAVDTKYEARIRFRGGDWSDWAEVFTLGNDAPSFDSTSYEFSLDENVSGKEERIRLGKVTATDPNAGDEVTYEVEATERDRFSITKTGGILYYIGSGEDHESTPVINVTITATGGEGERELSATVSVAVNILNVSEPIYFADDAEIVFDEDFEVGTYVEIQLPKAIGGDGSPRYSVDPELPDGLSVGSGSGILRGTPTEPSPRTQYTYTASDDEEESVSLEFELRVFGASPKPPTDLEVVKESAKSITIEWVNPSSPFITIVSHRIEHRKKGAIEWLSDSIEAFATTYTIEGLTRDTLYQIRVKNVADTGYVATSSTLEASTDPYDLPSEPRNVRVADQQIDSLTIAWSPPADSGGRNIAVYDVRYRQEGTTEWTEEEVRKSTSLTIENLTIGTTYEVQVRAVNSVGAGPWTEVLLAMTAAHTPPDKPRSPRITDREFRSLSVTWLVPLDDGGSPITSYDIRYRELIDGEWEQVNTAETDITLANLEVGTQYLIQIRAVNAIGEGDWTDTLSARTLINHRPVFAAGATIANQVYTFEEPIPTLQLPRGSSGNGLLSYSFSPELPKGLRFNGVELQLVGTPTEVQETTVYEYTVSDSDEFTEDDSSTLEFSITVNANTPLAPTIRVSNISFEDAQVSWSEPNSRGAAITSYEVELREMGTTTARMQTTTTTTATLEDLVPVTAYEVRVRAMNSIGPSDWSVWVAFTTTKVPAEIRSRPLLYAYDLTGSSLGSSAVELIGARALPTIGVQEESEYEPPYFFQLKQPLTAHSGGFPHLSKFRLNQMGMMDNLVWSVWGGFESSSTEANYEDSIDNLSVMVPLDSSHSNAWLGAEIGFSTDVRFGLAVSQNSSTVEAQRVIRGTNQVSSEVDEVELTVTSIYPYVVGSVMEQFVVWGTIGRGSGSSTLTDKWGELADIDLTSSVIAAGARFSLDNENATGIAVISDYFQATVESDAFEAIDIALSSEVRRLRGGAQGRWFIDSETIDLVPTIELLGRFENGGIADGTNIDFGIGLDVLLNVNWGIDIRVRSVRSMEEEQYSASGFGVTLRRESTINDDGMTLSLQPALATELSSFNSLQLDEDFLLSQSLTESADGTRLLWSYRFRSPSGLAQFEPYSAFTQEKHANRYEFGLRWSKSPSQNRNLSVDISSLAVDRQMNSNLFEWRVRFGLRF